MIPWPDAVSILGIALLWGLIVGAAGLVALRLARRAPMVVQVSVVALTGTLTVVAGMIAVARAMFLSPHDLAVSLWIAGIAVVISLGVALVVGATFVRQTRRVRRIAAALGDGDRIEAPDAAEAAAASASELADVVSELERTSRRLAESREEVAALDESRRELIAWISHDLRTPLAGLRAMSEALEDGLAEDPARFHRQMRMQVDRISDLVDDLFELSKIQSGRLVLHVQTVSLHDLVSDAVAGLRAFADSRQVAIREASGEAAGEAADAPTDADVLVRADAGELGRVVGNLLMNAIQHSRPGGEITVTTASDTAGRAVLTVSDQGGGIDPGDLEHVFRPGWRAATSRTPDAAADARVDDRDRQRSSGAGLGLAIAEGIVHAHDGEISVRNVPGGCRFEVGLPGLAA